MRKMIPNKLIEWVKSLLNHVAQNGNTTEVGGHLEVDGNTSINGDLQVAGEANITSSIAVNGDTSLNGDTYVSSFDCVYDGNGDDLLSKFGTKLYKHVVNFEYTAFDPDSLQTGQYSVVLISNSSAEITDIEAAVYNGAILQTSDNGKQVISLPNGVAIHFVTVISGTIYIDDNEVFTVLNDTVTAL